MFSVCYGHKLHSICKDPDVDSDSYMTRNKEKQRR